ncbi:MAG: DUF2784 domain-containing protein [Acidimicrobiales bacterium]
MVYRLMADAVVVVHFGFILFVAVGGLLAWRWPRLVWLHVPVVVWGIGIVVLGFDCPLTPLEKYFRRLGAEEGYEGGFVDRYVEDVIYPGTYTPLLRALAAVAIVAGWARVVAHRRRRGRRVPEAEAAVHGWVDPVAEITVTRIG